MPMEVSQLKAGIRGWGGGGVRDVMGGIREGESCNFCLNVWVSFYKMIGYN